MVAGYSKLLEKITFVHLVEGGLNTGKIQQLYTCGLVSIKVFKSIKKKKFKHCNDLSLVVATSAGFANRKGRNPRLRSRLASAPLLLPGAGSQTRGTAGTAGGGRPGPDTAHSRRGMRSGPGPGGVGHAAGEQGTRPAATAAHTGPLPGAGPSSPGDPGPCIHTAVLLQMHRDGEEAHGSGQARGAEARGKTG